ncbi:MAG: hypothetical protein ABIN97_08880 [Ginsengibacter sp.]
MKILYQSYSRKIRIILVLIFSFFIFNCLAQRDTSRNQTIDVTSSYKPALKEVIKINLSASPLDTDTLGRKLTYNIPPQNLFFSHQPTSLKPLALTQDTGLSTGIKNYVKAGFGNFSTPYLNGAFSFGDGKTRLLNLYGSYIASKGKIEHQDFSELKMKATGSYFTPENEAYGSIGISQYQYFLFGYDHSLHTFSKDDIRRKYQDISLKAGYRNTKENDLKINYDPNIAIHVFSRENKSNEATLILNAPVEKKFGDKVSFKIIGRAEINSLSNKTGPSEIKVNNNLIQLAPELVYYSDRFTFHGGITPTWNNNELSVLPNIYGEAQLQNNILLVQAGWVGRFIQNSFRSLSLLNPYMQDPATLYNTKEVQFYGGIKATLGKHFSFNTKAAFITYNNMPLFVNDTSDGKSFFISNESRLNNLQLHGDMNYVSQDKFTLSAALDLNTYSGLKNNANAWHLIPVQLTGSLRWNAFKQVLIKGDVFAFSQVPALLKNNVEKKLKGGIDISTGAEFKITNKFSAWLDFNNLLNRKYERWNNYPVYGLNVIGGIIMHF